MGLTAKEKAKAKLLDYLGNPENPFLSRAKLSIDVLGYKGANQLNCLFLADEIRDIEEEALEIRKKHCAPQRSRVYAALLKEAEAGNVKAMREYLDRTEGKVIDKKEITGGDGAPLAPVLNVKLTGA